MVHREIEDAVRQVCCKYPSQAAIIYGSRISGDWDTHSDIDVLLIDNVTEAPMRQDYLIASGREIDIAIAGSDVISKKLKERERLNSHWLLNAFSKCTILYDRIGEAQRLHRMAEKLWNEGPPPMRREEIESARSGLRRMLIGADRIGARSASAQNAALAKMRSDQATVTGIFLFYCLRGKWTTAFPRLIVRCEQEYPDLYALWNQYLHAPDLPSALKIAQTIAELSFAHIPY